MIHRLFTLKALSPVHCGIGQGLADIDLPVARNSISNHPIIPGSSIKGVLKDEFLYNGLGEGSGKEDWKDMALSLFGENKDGGDNEFASAVSVGDANLLALPVRSFYGTFAYIVSPFTLHQFKQTARRDGGSEEFPPVPGIGLADERGSYKAIICDNSLLKQQGCPSILLEEMDLLIEEDTAPAREWANRLAPLFFKENEGQDIFKKRFAIVDDNALNFCCNCGLPVDARISINEKTGTVEDGALWYEETVPPESLFTGVMGVDRSHMKDKQINSRELAAFLASPGPIYCQVGGKATTGRGFVEIKISDLQGN